MSLRFIRVAFGFLIAVLMTTQSWSYNVVVNNKSSVPVAEFVKQILPYTFIDPSVKVLVRPGNSKVARFRLKAKELRVTYNKKFDEQLKKDPFGGTDVLMLLTKAFAEHEGFDPIYMLGEIMAYKGVSRDQVRFYSKKITREGYDWLNKAELDRLLAYHKEFRWEMLNGGGEMAAPVVVSEPVPESGNSVGAGGPENAKKGGLSLESGDESDDETDLGAGDKSGAESIDDSDDDTGFESGDYVEAPVVSEESVEDQEPNNSVVKVYYATNREKNFNPQKTHPDDVDPNEYYGGKPKAGNELNYGFTLVNIPKVHEKGKLERPSVVRLEFWQPPVEDPNKHIMLTKVQELNSELFFGSLKGESKRVKTAFVFVHGFNVNFDSAARVTAQLSFDAEFKGTPILFSWPSDGTVLDPTAYLRDMRDAKSGGRRLSEFLFELIEKGGYEAINLVAHSMGNLAVTHALDDFQRRMMSQLSLNYNENKRPFRSLVMYAPDIDVEEFQYHKPYIEQLVEHISVYASDNDKAITFSASMREAPRLGGYVRRVKKSEYCREGLMYLAHGVDSIDATNVNLGLFSPLNHSYYGEYKFVTDFGLLMSGDDNMKNPEARGFGKPIKAVVDGEDYKFWGAIPCK